MLRKNSKIFISLVNMTFLEAVNIFLELKLTQRPSNLKFMCKAHFVTAEVGAVKQTQYTQNNHQ
ncbi:hypothetical protein BM527_16655 [Alteromonas sp. Mex14]|nr:hypothetical protein BM527_16655 [Alteromonas sp. Mex14]